MCSEAVLVMTALAPYHRRKCFAQGNHKIHKATHPNGTQNIMWYGRVGKTKIWLVPCD